MKYDKVPVASLKKWNHLQSDDLTVGRPVIVGFLKVDKAYSSLATHRSELTAQIVEVPKKEVKPEEKKPEQTAVAVPEVSKPEPEKTKTVAATTPAAVPPADGNKVTITSVNTKSSINFSGGYFKNLYSIQTENKSPVNNNGVAGVFKSTSGWQDGKYYCFNNDVSAGSVVKITNNATGKSVYAKVLDAIPDIKQNEGLSIVISNAAAEELGEGENRFDCEVSFGK